MTFCRFDEFEDAVLSIELAAEKFSEVQNSPTLWKWVIIAMQNAVQSAMVLALTGTDGCGAILWNSPCLWSQAFWFKPRCPARRHG
jgi:hypothetical protein